MLESGKFKPSELLKDHEPKPVDHLKGKTGIADFWKSIVL